MIRTERRQEDGTILILSRSVVHKEAPERKGYNRSEVEVSGFVIKPCGATSSVVIYVNQANMKGKSDSFQCIIISIDAVSNAFLL